jgi:hypothetical protein
MVSCMRRLTLVAACLLAISLTSVLATGCFGGTAETPSTSSAQVAAPATTATTVEIAATATTVAQTTTSTLSQHERVQQEQAQQEAQTAATTQTTAAGRSSTGLITVEDGKTLLIADGGVLTSEEVAQANVYAPFATGAQKEQQRLVEEYTRLMDKNDDWVSADFSKLRSLVSSEKGLLSQLNGKTAPALYSAAHTYRTDAAQLFIQAWQTIYDAKSSDTANSTSGKVGPSVSQGLSINLKAIEAWGKAENETQHYNGLIKHGKWT